MFGAVRSSSGTGSTEYRFTGQHDDASVGYAYLRARYYDPQTGRFLTKDPVRGIPTNPGSQHYYTYVQNNPTNWTDASGRCPLCALMAASRAAWRLVGPRNRGFLRDFLLGWGETERTYGPDTRETQEMMKSPGAKALRNAFYGGGCNDIGPSNPFEYPTFRAAMETAINPFDWSNTAAQVGGFSGATAINNGNGTVTFTIVNYAGMKSFFYQLPFVSDRAEGETGPMRTIKQTFEWTEEF